MPWRQGPADLWQTMGNWLRNLGREIVPRPRAVLVISAHWETERFRLTTSPVPRLLYDYSGFPEHTYRLRYPVPGAPWLAEAARMLLLDAGLDAELDTQRGLDHGAFVPFKLIYPQADIPLVQLSLRSDLDPVSHLAAGAALAGLRREGVLIVGSGMSFHNLNPQGSDIATRAQVFDDWLARTLALAPQARREALCHWTQAPHARFAHPREEHLLPLMVACGSAVDAPAQRLYAEQLGGLVAVSGYRFG